jgi:hypothetical protein
VPKVEAAFETPTRRNATEGVPCRAIAVPQSPLVVVAIDAGLLVQELHVAVEPVPPQVHQPAAALEDPLLDAVVHLPRPILRVRAEDEDAVGIEVELAEVELRLGVVVVVDPLPLEPRQEPPLRRRQVARRPAGDRIGRLHVSRGRG